ncbi:MAG: hypothetical protein CME64_03465 [Halobacteriovoraceae bacterium]|nr:hypothetical protein [Halobacteriovoraceae bacterium]|tara:strand:+ start:36466 stop:37911 length:1446 start_codon:yes stop_codon:yes gene_type:complete
MDHFLNISPYRVLNQEPFSKLISVDNDQPTTLILYSKFSDNWLSMAKINKRIISKVIEQNPKTIPYVIDVTDKHFEENYELILKKCSSIICMNLSKETGLFLKKLRQTISISCNFVITNNLKSLGYQFKYFGLDAFDESDSFLCLCESDMEILRTLFPKNPVKKLDILSVNVPKKKFKGTKNIVFFGRLHPDKGITEIINSFQAYRLKYGALPNYTINFFGEFDYTGKSNSQSRNYQDTIQKQLEVLGYKDQVKFHGYKDQNTIRDFCERTSPVGVFLSTYSNENYGIALREFLSWNTAPAIISRWGAHQDLIKEYKSTNRIIEVDVNLASNKPMINPFEVAKAIKTLDCSTPLYMAQIYSDESDLVLQKAIKHRAPIDKSVLLKKISRSEKSVALDFNRVYAKDAKILDFDSVKIFLGPLISVRDCAIYLDNELILEQNTEENSPRRTYKAYSFLNNEEVEILENHVEYLVRENLAFLGS